MAKVKSKTCIEGCPVDATLQLIGGKWKGIILYHLMKKNTLRFGELKKSLPTVTQRMLTKQLRELEDDKLVTRKIYPEVPPKVEYTLTDYGASLRDIIKALEAWGKKNA